MLYCLRQHLNNLGLPSLYSDITSSYIELIGVWKFMGPFSSGDLKSIWKDKKLRFVGSQASFKLQKQSVRGCN